MTFMGWKRSDGRVGIRNHVLVLPASVCASDVAEQIASRVQGAVTFHNQNGCSQVPSDQQLTMDVMAGYAANPNVWGTLVVSLGCENCQMDLVCDAIRERTDKPIERVIIQEVGGSLRAVEEGTRLARSMVEKAAREERVSADFSNIVLGTECGGSDPTSGLAANPLVGLMSDWIVDQGGTSILSETPELIGAEHILARRAVTEEVGKRIYDIIYRYEDAMARVGEKIREGNPSPGNKAGGITTLEEKSLGCIHKSGHRAIQAVYDYAKQIDTTGLVVMDTPGNDPSSVAGMVAGGAQVVVFTTGRGTPTGHPIAPVIKITGNRETFARMRDNIDIDASPFIFEPERKATVRDEAIALLLQVINGVPTRAEALGFVETAIARVCNYV
ncbi:UxaA family hydrolase [uncultured Enorma sp.]|uniref:UxaA family hydrolase n=1 Tax=uncultured Enorma sp. TaxID=1714346 RepID=UPI0034575BDE